MGYGVFRFGVEFTREPDGFLGLLSLGLSMGQWLSLPMALAGGGSFTARKINLHARTNLDVISKFLAVRFELEDGDGYTRVTLFR